MIEITRYTPNSTVTHGGDTHVYMELDQQGSYMLYSDFERIIDSIGAGGVSGRVTQKTLEQHRKEFEAWAKIRSINVKHKDHVNYLSQGFYKYDLNSVEHIWQAWLASKGTNV